MIANAGKKVLFIGTTVPGSRHDYSLFKTEFDPAEAWFKAVTGWLDLGYQGIKTDDQSAENINIPHKKPRKSKHNPTPALTDKQKRENRAISRKRVAVEQAIGGMKIFRILSIRFRNRLKKLADDVIFLAAGLWNLKISFPFNGLLTTI